MSKNQTEDRDDDDLFEMVANAKHVATTYANRLGIGRHRLCLKRYRVKDSKKDMGRIIEADFMVLESTVHEAAETRGWAWFVESAGWAGKYESERAQGFLKIVGECIGDDRPLNAIGADLKGAKQLGRGLVLDCEVTGQFDKGGKPKCGADNNQYTSIEWTPISQSLEQLAEQRKDLDAQSPVEEDEAEKEEEKPQKSQPKAAAKEPTTKAAKPFNPPTLGKGLLRKP